MEQLEVARYLKRRNDSGWKFFLLFLLLIFLLYVFICCISLLTNAFRLLFSASSDDVLNSRNLENPLLALMMGVIATALIHSSSTVTSVVVALVGSKTITVREGIPVIMGSNIGTSVTCILVSLAHIKNKEEYVKGFTAAIQHDLFNWCTVLVLLPIELAFGFLENISESILHTIDIKESERRLELLYHLVRPVVEGIIRLKEYDDLFLDKSSPGHLSQIGLNMTDEFEERLFNESFYNESADVSIMEDYCEGGCHYLFYSSGLSDQSVGGIILFFTAVVLLICFFLLVRILRRLFQSQLFNIVKRITARLEDGRASSALYGFVLLVGGALTTILLQSSTVFTAAIIPVVTSGLLQVNHAYPAILGSNLGTTTTGLLAALSTKRNARLTIQMALCHMFFNLMGILLFYPIPMLRFPLIISKLFGEKVIKYSWFSIFYLAVSFVLLPLFIYGVSLGGILCMYIVLIPLVTFILLVIFITYLQVKRPGLLPRVLQDWSFLPKPLRTFATINYIVQTYMEVFCCCIVSRTVAAVPVLKDPTAFMGQAGGLNEKLTGQLQLMKIERENMKKEGPAQRMMRRMSLAIVPQEGDMPTKLGDYNAGNRRGGGFFEGMVNDDLKLVKIDRQSKDGVVKKITRIMQLNQVQEEKTKQNQAEMEGAESKQ